MENYVDSFEEIEKLSEKSPYYFRGTGGNTSGWKMHLFLNVGNNGYPSLHDERLKKISKFLVDEKLEHKFKNGCDGENTICIYLKGGNRDDFEVLAQKLKGSFGKDFASLSPLGNSFEGSDLNLLGNKNIGIRFEGVEDALSGSPFFRYGKKGVPDLKVPGLGRNTVIAKNILGRDVPSDQEEKLKRVACHLILAKHCGEKYLGKNYAQNNWDKEFFEDVSEFSAKEIEKLVKYWETHHPEKYIKEGALAEKGKGIEIDVAQKMSGFGQSKKEANLAAQEPTSDIFPLKDHGFTLSNADGVVLAEKSLTWQQGDKKLAKYAPLEDGYVMVSLYDKDQNEAKFMIHQNNIYRVVGGKAEKLEKNSVLVSKISNIASESKALEKQVSQKNQVNRIVKSFSR